MVDSKNTIHLLLPKQPNKFNNIHYNFYFLKKGLEKLGTIVEILELSEDGSSNLPDEIRDQINAEQVKYDQLNHILSRDGVFVGLDDYEFLSRLRNTDERETMIWVHYLNGSSLFLRQYINWQITSSFVKFVKKTYRGVVPTYLQFWLLRNYINSLKNRFIFAQSLWTALLLNRVYNVTTKGIVYNPVNPSEYPTQKDITERDKVSIFLAGPNDTWLNDAISLIPKLMRKFGRLQLHAFGNKELTGKLSRMVGTDITFHSDISRKDLFELFSESYFTLTPVYGGNFEMVPIESLMCYTPVITYLQPFIEVTGKSSMIANIQNEYESINMVSQFEKTFQEGIPQLVRNRLVSSMNYETVAYELIRLVEGKLRK